MRNYLDNQRELINTHKQYLELNNLYQNNITTYMNSILQNSVVASDGDNITTDDEVLSNATYNLSDNTNTDDTDDVVQDNTNNERTLSREHSSNNTNDTLEQTSFDRIMQEHNHNMDVINSNSIRRPRRRVPYINIETPINELNRQGIISNDDINYNNMSVPTAIINQECDIVPYNSLNTQQDICPIDHAPFEENENVMRIRFCGHIFRENNLRENFRSRATCPVCRHNIITTVTNRNYRQNTTSDNIDWFIRY